MKKTPPPPTRSRKENIEKATLLLLIAQDYLRDVLHHHIEQKNLDDVDAIINATEGLIMVTDMLREQTSGSISPAPKTKKPTRKRK